jgi:hypothetical protein
MIFRLGAFFSIFYLLMLNCLPTCSAGEFDYLPEYAGKTTTTVTGSHIKLNKSEAGEFKRNLERLRNLLAKQPTLASPRGVEIKGYFRPKRLSA